MIIVIDHFSFSIVNSRYPFSKHLYTRKQIQIFDNHSLVTLLCFNFIIKFNLNMENEQVKKYLSMYTNVVIYRLFVSLFGEGISWISFCIFPDLEKVLINTISYPYSIHSSIFPYKNQNVLWNDKSWSGQCGQNH